MPRFSIVIPARDEEKYLPKCLGSIRAASEPFADVYELEMRAAAVTHGVYLAMANRAGTEEPLTFLGQSMVVDPMGRIVTSLDDSPDQVTTAVLDGQTVAKARYLFPFLRDRRPETYDLLNDLPRDEFPRPT